MVLKHLLRITLSVLMSINFSASAFADTASADSSTTTVGSCSGGPDCVVFAGVMLLLSGLDLKAATAEKMDSVPGSLVIFCKQEGVVPEMNFPCGPTEVEVVHGLQKQTLNFRGGKIVIPRIEDGEKITVLVRARGCKEVSTIHEAKSGDVANVQLSAACSK